MLILQVTPEELRDIIREEVTKIVNPCDRIIDRKEAARLLGKSVKTIARMQNRGEINPLHQDGHPRYSFNEIRGKLL